MRHTDPRIRQTLNQISQNIESVNLTTQASLFTFSQTYISPCLSSVHTCLEASCHPCFGARDDRRPHRNARRGRDDLAFDFYDDWEEDEGEWGNDELDRLLAGSDGQPARQRGMSYGSRVVRRKSFGVPKDKSDPNIVPKSSIFGFLESLPWKIGGKGFKYRPSAADLQENVGRGRGEGEPLIEEGDEGDADAARGRSGRNRSGTTASRSTTNSLSSRGDLFPSEDEDDAIPLDDEFAMMLERRNTGATLDDHSSGKTRGSRPVGSRTSTKTGSSKGTKSTAAKPRATSASSGNVPGLAEAEDEDVPSMTDLKQEEEHVSREEEAQIEKRRHAAQILAQQRGLGNRDEDPHTPEDGHEPKMLADVPVGKSPSREEPGSNEPS
ncbi:hypothetical protein MMC07_006798 [Pseudocyphellaria aurata]|nr:hypothetical protein [Pseudocyphellaria aurata]